MSEKNHNLERIDKITLTGSKHLAQVLSPTRFVGGCINVVPAPVGSGKTYFSLEELPKHVQRGKYMLYITNTCMNREQILATARNTRSYSKKWREFINSNTKPFYPHVWGTFKDPYSYIVVLNYAQVGAILYYGHKFDWSKFEYIVCDELHNLINYKKIKPKKGQVNTNFCDITIDKIKDTLCNHPNTKIIGLSATPDNICQEFSNINYILTDTELKTLYQYEVFNNWAYRDYVKILRAIPKGSKGIIYFDRITALKKVESILQQRGHNTASFWSLNNDDWIMTQRQIDVRQYIVQYQMIPQDVDILLINAACQTGVNMKNTDIEFMVVHSQDNNVITQVRGRLRHDLDTLYFFDKNAIDTPNPIPVEYLNCPLTPVETAAVCDEVRLMRAKGNEPYKWGKTKDYLLTNGYRVYKKSLGHGGLSKYWYIEKI